MTDTTKHQRAEINAAERREFKLSLKASAKKGDPLSCFAVLLLDTLSPAKNKRTTKD